MSKRVRFEPHDKEWWVECDKGCVHYGEYGAAGLLLRSGDEVLLQHRAPWVDSPNTWSIPAGALRRDESAILGALREAAEEGVRRRRRDPHDLFGRSTVVTDDHGGWAFHTVIVDVDDKAEWTSYQSMEGALRWLSEEEIIVLRDMGRLHPGFAEFFEQHPDIFKEA